MKMNNFEMNPEINGIKVEEANAIKIQHVHSGESTTFEKILAWLSPGRFEQVKDIDIESTRQHLCNMQQFLDDNPDVTELSQGGIIVKKAPMSPQIRSEMEQTVTNAISLNARKMIREQINLEKVALNALEVNKDDMRPNQPISEDWWHAFQEGAKGFSDDTIQTLWGKLLAGEIKQPGSFSLRTLSVLQTMNSHEANILSLVSKYEIKDIGIAPYFTKDSLHIGNEELDDLVEAGCLLKLKYDASEFNRAKKFPICLLKYNYALDISVSGKDLPYRSTKYKLSRVGKEITSLLSYDDIPSKDFFLAIKNYLLPVFKNEKFYILNTKTGEREEI